MLGRGIHSTCRVLTSLPSVIISSFKSLLKYILNITFSSYLLRFFSPVPSHTYLGINPPLSFCFISPLFGANHYLKSYLWFTYLVYYFTPPQENRFHEVRVFYSCFVHCCLEKPQTHPRCFTNAGCVNA